MMVQGINRKINYKVKESRPVDAGEWIKVADTHDAIIPRNIFESVQELLRLDTRTAPGEEMVNVFSGLVRCSDCEQNMVKRSTTKNGKKYYYYHCTTYKNTGDCSAHLISVDKLYEAVLAQVQLQIKKLIKADSLLKEVDALPDGNFKMKALQEQFVSLEKEITRYTELKVKLYTDMSDKLISRDEYEELNKRFSQKMEAARKAQVEIEQQKEKLNLPYIHKQGWVEEFKQYGNIETLDRKTAIALIEKIIVYDKDTIEICFRYRDEMELLFSAAEEYAKQRMGSTENLIVFWYRLCFMPDVT